MAGPIQTIQQSTRPAACSFANNGASNTGFQAKASGGAVAGISVNTPETASTVTLYDGMSTSGRKIGTFVTTAAGYLPLPGINFATGLYAVTTGGTPPDVTVLFY